MKDKYMSQNKYDANNTRKFGLKLNRKTDKELIEKLESVDSRTASAFDFIQK